MPPPTRVIPSVPLAPMLAAGLLVFTIALLRLEGRRWWCAAGDWNLVSAEVHGPHNSQHVFDPYSFTHVLHGVIFCGVLCLCARRLSFSWQFVLSLGLECGWEIVENSAWIIERYRAATAARGYIGDSVINSLGDILSCAIGMLLAQRVGWRWSLVIVLATELALLAWIRDCLTLNVVMLLAPVEAIRNWQTGA